MWWEIGSPTKPGCYLLEFEEGDRFVVVRYNQGELENLDDGGYITDPVKQHLKIPDPDDHNCSSSFGSKNIWSKRNGKWCFCNDKVILAKIIPVGSGESRKWQAVLETDEISPKGLFSSLQKCMQACESAIESQHEKHKFPRQSITITKT
jgi:hypothetical protein